MATGRNLLRALDLATLVGMAGGIGLLLQPWIDGGLPVGFFLTAGCTIGQVVVAHLIDRLDPGQ